MYIYYGTDGGEDTEDSIFLLSLKEAYHYFSDSADRMAAPTGYAIRRGASVSSEFLVGNGEGAGGGCARLASMVAVPRLSATVATSLSPVTTLIFLVLLFAPLYG